MKNLYLKCHFIFMQSLIDLFSCTNIVLLYWFSLQTNPAWTAGSRLSATVLSRCMNSSPHIPKLTEGPCSKTINYHLHKVAVPSCSSSSTFHLYLSSFNLLASWTELPKVTDAQTPNQRGKWIKKQRLKPDVCSFMLWWWRTIWSKYLKKKKKKNHVHHSGYYLLFYQRKKRIIRTMRRCCGCQETSSAHETLSF